LFAGVGTTAVGNREMKHPLRGLDEGARLIGSAWKRGGWRFVWIGEVGIVE